MYLLTRHNIAALQTKKKNISKRESSRVEFAVTKARSTYSNISREILYEPYG
jgi:hypothetical protein